MTLAIHTDAPLMVLTTMFRTDVHVEIGRTMRGEADCIYGWRERQDRPECRPHHILTDADDDTIHWVATTLAMLGHQVVVTAPVDPDDQTGDHDLHPTMPYLYLDEHGH